MAESYQNIAIRKNLISKETVLVPKKTFGSVPINVALVYPNTYTIGMSNLGFHSIFYQVNSRDDALCHRAFFSLKNSIDDYINTLEADKPINEYDIIGFSISFELDYINILKILDTMGIPLSSKERQGPLIMAGGPALTCNPEPLADFIDFFVIGEGEEIIHEIIKTYREHKSSSKDEILEVLAQIEGVYVPQFCNVDYDETENVTDIKTHPKAQMPVKRRWIKNLDDYNTESVILTPYTEFKNMFLLEVSRGCGRNCRFCMAGYCYRVPRQRSLDKVLERAEYGARFMQKIGLVGAAVSDFPFIDKLAEELIKSRIKFSVSSLRADSLREPLMAALAYSGHKTLTVAPEAGSERLRKVINKGISEEHVVNAAKLARKFGIKNLKLYYIIGLPYEKNEDIDEMIEFLVALKNTFKNSYSNLTVSINPFIPKPFTPFQWIGMEDIKLLNEKIKLIQNKLKPHGIKVIFESPRMSEIQAGLARGNRHTAKLLYEIYKNGATNSAFSKTKIDGKGLEFYAHREIDKKAVLPWEHINIGLSKAYFLGEYNRATNGQPTEKCTEEKCQKCRICQIK